MAERQRKKHRNVRIADALWESAAALAVSRGETVSDAVRWGLHEYVRCFGELPVNSQPLKDLSSNSPDLSSLAESKSILSLENAARLAWQLTRSTEFSGTSRPVVWGNVPTRNPSFTGREDLLCQMKTRLIAGVTAVLPQAIYGLGGVGKTQLAVEYAYRYAGDYATVWWIAAEQPPLIRASLAELATRLGISNAGGLNQTVTAVLDALRRGDPYGQSLLIFDNAGQPSEVAPFIPYGAAHVLITSRNKNWSLTAETLEVDTFTREESVRLLNRRCSSLSHAEADVLADKLGDLPLALDQAASWLVESGMPVHDYVELFDAKLTQLLDSSYPKSVLATWSLAFDGLKHNSPAAAQLLQLCAFLGPEPIPWSLLIKGRYIDLPVPLSVTVRDELALRQAIRNMHRYALAKVDINRNSVEIHRLTQAILRNSMPEKDREEYRRCVHALLASANPGNPELPENWPAHSGLSVHILPTGLIEADTDDARRLILDQVAYLCLIGDLVSSQELGFLARRHWLEAHGPDHVQTLELNRRLAITLRLLGNYDEARELNSDTLIRFRGIFGDNHESTLLTADAAAADLRIQGKISEALAVDQDTFVRQKEIFGEDDPYTIRSAHNLAVNLRLMGDFRSALKMDEETAARRARVQGEQHPFTFFTRSSIAYDLYGCGDYDKARKMLEEIVPVYRHRRGEKHYEVLQASRFLSTLLRKTGANQEALALAEETRALCRENMSPSHLDTLAAGITLINALRVLGLLDRAVPLALEVHGEYRRRIGNDHFLTHVCAVNVAILMRAAGQTLQAQRLNRKTLQGLQSTLGRDHPYTLCCETNLASDLYVAGEYSAARTLSERILGRFDDVMGADHPYSLACAANLTVDLRMTGNSQAAQRLLSKTLARYRTVLGAEHPETLAASSRVRIDCDIDPPPT